MSVQLIWKPDSSCNRKKLATLGSRLMNSHRCRTWSILNFSGFISKTEDLGHKISWTSSSKSPGSFCIDLSIFAAEAWITVEIKNIMSLWSLCLLVLWWTPLFRWTVRHTLMPYDQQSSINRYYQLQTSYQFWLFGLENLHSTRMFCETVNHSESLYMWMQLAESTMMWRKRGESTCCCVMKGQAFNLFAGGRGSQLW
jgi:hypothetical protein